MRIGVVASVSHHIESFWLDLADEIRKMGHVVHFAAGDDANFERYTRLAGVTRRPSVSNTRSFGAIRKWVADKGLDLVITNTATVSTLVRLADLTVPVVYFAHGLHWNRETGLGYWVWSTLEKVALKRTAAFIVLNEEDRRWLMDRSSQPVLRLEFGVGLPLEKFEQSRLPAETRAVWIGEFSKRKRPELAILATRELLATMPTFRLSMLGVGPRLDRCKKLAESLGLRDVITFHGFTAPGPHLVRSRVLVHTAAWEGLPRVFLEALASGRRVVAVDAKGVRNIPGVSVVPSALPKELAEAIQSEMSSEGFSLGGGSREVLSTTSAAGHIVEFVQSVHKAYLENSDRQVVLGKKSGPAPERDSN